MTWHAQYRTGGSDHILRAPTPEAAIETACHLIDEGSDVFGVGTGPLTDSIARNEIARIYAIWAREKQAFGQRQCQPEFKHATQRVTIAILLAECEAG